jgi:hypothetical protein
MEQRMSIRLKGHSLIKSVHDKRIVIVTADLVSYDPAVIKIQDGAQIYLMDFCADVILELSYISQPCGDPETEEEQVEMYGRYLCG